MYIILLNNYYDGICENISINFSVKYLGELLLNILLDL